MNVFNLKSDWQTVKENTGGHSVTLKREIKGLVQGDVVRTQVVMDRTKLSHVIVDIRKKNSFEIHSFELTHGMFVKTFGRVGQTGKIRFYEPYKKMV